MDNWGVDDFTLNCFTMMIGKATLICFGVLPMTILMMQVVPQNIEASMFAVITACITFSTDWGGDVVGAYVTEQFGITDEDMTNLHLLLFFKILMIFVCMECSVVFLPTNEQVMEIVARVK